ncbi:unnamed protein product [Closterium sp. Naga37s-1]|nr:unnamed protein product [Closterium sp. Naga37s-1]
MAATLAQTTLSKTSLQSLAVPSAFPGHIGQKNIFKKSEACSLSTSWFDEEAFLRAVSAGSNVIPISRRIFSDHLTPVLAYRCLVKEDDRDAPSFLFESVETANDGRARSGRYSYVGAQPALEVVARGVGPVSVVNHDLGKRETIEGKDPLQVVQDLSATWKPAACDSLPNSFCGGWVGYTSYDSVRYVESKKLPFSSAPMDDRHLPDVHLSLYNDVVVFDHVTKIVHVVCWVHVDDYPSASDAFSSGLSRLSTLVDCLQPASAPVLPAGSVNLDTRQQGPPAQSTMTREQFEAAVLSSKENILAGDIFQIVLSQRFERRTFADPFEVYRALRIVNPSPYLAYLQARGSILVASSPEILCRISGSTVVNRPLAGTRRRGQTAEEDLALEEDLLADEKEVAEHVMLVDLGRNDVGKVSVAGSVVVEKLMESDSGIAGFRLLRSRGSSPPTSPAGTPSVPRTFPLILSPRPLSTTLHHPLTLLLPPTGHGPLFPHLTCWNALLSTHFPVLSLLPLPIPLHPSPPLSTSLHLSPTPLHLSPLLSTHSQVTGKLLPQLTCWDALRAALPVGTVSGAPKVRAMELIDELEVTRRGPYAGGIGYVSFAGNMDFALALRTMVFPTSSASRSDTLFAYNSSSGSNSGSGKGGGAGAGLKRRQEWVVHVQAGAGVVADSVPAAEWQETVNKAAALGRAIDLAESAFVHADRE